jgi:hypothetical protein
MIRLATTNWPWRDCRHAHCTGQRQAISQMAFARACFPTPPPLHSTAPVDLPVPPPTPNMPSAQIQNTSNSRALPCAWRTRPAQLYSKARPYPTLPQPSTALPHPTTALYSKAWPCPNTAPLTSHCLVRSRSPVQPRALGPASGQERCGRQRYAFCVSWLEPCHTPWCSCAPPGQPHLSLCARMRHCVGVCLISSVHSFVLTTTSQLLA